MRRTALRRPALALLLGASLAAPGCSISASSESLSKSVSSPFKSSSASSGGESDDPAYQDEVRSYAAGFARSGSDANAFRRGVGSIAERRGIHDWEDDDATCRAIGAGLEQAELNESRAEALAGDLLAGRADRVEVVMKGYQAAD
jgi:hypothetical protein